MEASMEASMEKFDELINIDLPKWSRMVISGNNITPGQAAEIIIRTADLEFFCNDDIWRRQLHKELGLFSIADADNNPKKWYSVYDNKDKFNYVNQSLGILDLQYLGNHQIATSFIGGPHGWCSWNGIIGYDNNIGKWPSVSAVLKEWKLIATTWPFLKLRCQLWNDENEEVDSSDSYDDAVRTFRPLVEFIIDNGAVSLSKPRHILKHHETPHCIIHTFLPNGERGCTIEQFKNAIKLIRKNLSEIPSESNESNNTN